MNLKKGIRRIPLTSHNSMSAIARMPRSPSKRYLKYFFFWMTTAMTAAMMNINNVDKK